MTTQKAVSLRAKRELLLDRIVREQKHCIALLAETLNLAHYAGTFAPDKEQAITLATEQAIEALEAIRDLEAGLEDDEGG